MKIRQAVSVIFKCGNEIFEISRQNYLRAFPGYTAFPGGKVDAEDFEDQMDKTLRNTLVREMSEELGIDILELEVNGTIRSIDYIALATSPEFNPSRFETYFFLINLNYKIPFVVDPSEFKAYSWIKPCELLDDFNQGQRLMVPPVRKLIEHMSQGLEQGSVLDLNLGRFGEIPVIEPIKNLIQAMPLSNTLPPASRTNMFIIGDDVKMIVDPSPKNEVEFKALINLLSDYSVGSIFITHHHADHHQFANKLAVELNVPIFISIDTHMRIKTKFSEQYFKDINVEFKSEGDIVTTWIGREVEVVEVPGHDEGHLALRPLTNEWCIVGDLFQGQGSVVIGDDEGNMSKYFESLKKIIHMSPGCVIPSHGIALGGTHILEKTLEHRERRESDILELTKKGHNPEEILKILYSFLPSSLNKYALKNIYSHLEKIQSERLID